MMLPVSVARLLRRAGRRSRQIGRALLDKPDPTYVEFQFNREDADPRFDGLIVALEEQLRQDSGAQVAYATRVYVRAEAVAWTTDQEELGEPAR